MSILRCDSPSKISWDLHLASSVFDTCQPRMWNTSAKISWDLHLASSVFGTCPWGGCRADGMRMESWWIFNALLASSVNRCDSPSKILQDLPYLFLIHAIKGCGNLLFLAHALWGGCRADDMRMESWWMFNAPLASSVNCGSNYSLSKIALWSRIFGNRLPFSMWMSYVTLKLLQFRINVGYHIFDFVSSWELVFFQSAFLIVLLYGISYAVQVMSLRWNPFEFLINSHQWMFHMALLWWMHGHYKVINWLPVP